MKHTLGHIILAHQNFDRVEALVKHLAQHNCPVAIHVDGRIQQKKFEALKRSLADLDFVRFIPRVSSEWGRFSLVQASLSASELLLKEFPDLEHIMLNSGACLPIRPVPSLKKFLTKRKGSDFIESVSIENEQWVKDGLNKERFTLYFPFSWKRNRKLFEISTKLQRIAGINRKLPLGLTPHLGSQWWCLTRRTLNAIINDPKRKVYDRYFQTVWIPDESYFQTLARLHSERLESKSLTWVKFDNQGKPYLLYDDHKELLLQSDCFMARKIWPKSHKLYDEFLNDNPHEIPLQKANPKLVNDKFDSAITRSTYSKMHPLNTGRYPANVELLRNQTARDYTVIMGGRFLFPDVQNWVTENSQGICHGNLFGFGKVVFAEEEHHFTGNISTQRSIRNYDPSSFLRNVIWNEKDQHQKFLFDLDDLQSARDFILKDKNAKIVYIKEAWTLQFWNLRHTGEDVMSQAKRLHASEQLFCKRIKRPSTKAKIIEFDVQSIIESPIEYLNELVGVSTTEGIQKLKEIPNLIDLTGFNKNLRHLRNKGFNIHMDQMLLNNDSPNGEKSKFTPKLIRNEK